MRFQFTIRALVLVLTAFAVAISAYAYLNRPEEAVTIIRTDVKATADLPRACVHVFLNKEDRPLGALLMFGEYPSKILPMGEGLYINSRLIRSPADGHVHVVSPSLNTTKCALDLSILAKHNHDPSRWGKSIHELVEKSKWDVTGER
jgi:hypothetical protein